MWRVEWDQDIKEHYKLGLLTNSDLEMAGVVLHYIVLEQISPMHHLHPEIWSDNSPATSCQLIRALVM